MKGKLTKQAMDETLGEVTPPRCVREGRVYKGLDIHHTVLIKVGRLISEYGQEAVDKAIRHNEILNDNFNNYGR